MDYSRIHHLFSQSGGEFTLPLALLSEKLQAVKAYLFDWDGVFNGGVKGQGISSLFSEPDSMGTNLLRFSHFLKTGQLPYVAIVTAMHNESAVQLAQREYFSAVFQGFKNKKEIFDRICREQNLQAHEVAFVFDDVLDLSIARECGVRMMIRRESNPLLLEYARENKLCDYLTGNAGNENGVREVCELILGMTDSYEKAIEGRIGFSVEYQTYLKQREDAHVDIIF
jgi:3-deoxy-D-manno-octulosonate 8-phosphate phosphatase (KDO 8-P phosphatase)